MSGNARVKINIQNGDIEFEGTEDFVSTQLTKLADTLKTISETLPKKQIAQQVKDTEVNIVKENNSLSSDFNVLDIPDTFGEWINKFPKKNMQQIDSILAAGYFYQKKNSDSNSFKTIYTSNLLKEQGIKITNPSVCTKRLLSNKYIFSISKGSKKGATSVFRVSTQGEEYLHTLIGK